MGPINATLNCLSKPFTFQGRATRSEFWWFNLVYILATIGATVWLMMPFFGLLAQIEADAAAAGNLHPMSDDEFMLAMGGFNTSMWVVSLAFIWPMFSQIAVTVRRLHDTDRSGWWWWIAAVPFVGYIILLILMVLPSDTGRNDYGPSAGGGSAKPRKAVQPSAAPAKRIPKGLPGEPYNPVNELTTAEELRALRNSRMAN